MNQRPRQILRELIAQHGPGLSGDPARCSAFLRDLCATDKAEIYLLRITQERMITPEFRYYIGRIPGELLIGRIARSLNKEYKIDEESARWAVESWALALGLLQTHLPDETAAAEPAHQTLSLGSPRRLPPNTPPTGSRGAGTAAGKSVGRATPPADRSGPTEPPLPELPTQAYQPTFARLFLAMMGPAVVLRDSAFVIGAVIINIVVGAVRPRPVPPAPEVKRNPRVRRLVIPVKRDHKVRAAWPVWFTTQFNAVQDYIEQERTDIGPVVLSGYDGFDGFSLAQEAIRQAAGRIARKTHSRSEDAVIQIHAKVERREGAGTALRIDDWLATINGEYYAKFRERFADVFAHYNPYPFYEKEDVTIMQRDRTSPTKLGVTFPGGGLQTERGDEALDTMTARFKPKARPAQVVDLLHMLNNSIPTESHERGREDKGIPFRLVLVIDGLDDCRLLECLDPFRWPYYKPKGLRVIAVLDKRSYDGCAAEGQHSKRALKKGITLKSCLPLWGVDIAGELAKSYFGMSEAQRGSALAGHFIKGLNFRCRGYPGNFERIVEEYLSEEGQESVSLNSQTIRPWKAYAEVGRVLDGSWKSILSRHLPAGVLKNPDSDRASSVRLLLYRVAEQAVAAWHDDPGCDLQDSCRKLAEEFRHTLSPSTAEGLCDDVIAALRRNDLLGAAETKRRARRTSPAGKTRQGRGGEGTRGGDGR